MPARDTAKVSLRRITRSVQPFSSMAGASVSSSTGRSIPARQYTPVGQTGKAWPDRPAAAVTAASASRSASSMPSRPINW